MLPARAQVKQQVESQVRCLPYPHLPPPTPTYPNHPLTFFLACAQIKVRDVSAQHFNRTFLICPPAYPTYPTHPLTFAALAHLRLDRPGRLCELA